MIDDGWFYTLGDGKTLGPITRDDLIRKIRSGQIDSNQFVWHASLADWQAISSIPELSGASPSYPPLLPSDSQTQKNIKPSPVQTVSDYIDKARQIVEGTKDTVSNPSIEGTKKDSWGKVSSVAGGLSGGLLFVGLCFTPMACCAVPISIGGIVSALFSEDRKLRKIGLIGNSIVLLLSLAIVLWLSFSMAFELSKIRRF